MDKIRAAAKQARAMEALADRMSRIEQQLSAPIAAEPGVLIESEPLATAAQIVEQSQQIAMLSEQIAAQHEQIAQLRQSIDQLIAAPRAAQQQSQRR